jgi:aryl carrier-like protein
VLNGEFSRQHSFHELGLSSIQVMEVHARLEKRLERRIPQVTLYEHPTIEALASHLAGGGQ